MEITFSDVRSREIVNIFDGKRLGRANDIVFNKESGQVLGIIVPSAGKIFRKKDDVFIAINKVSKIGDDVILVNLMPSDSITFSPKEKQKTKNGYLYNQPISTFNSTINRTNANGQDGDGLRHSYVRFKPGNIKVIR